MYNNFLKAQKNIIQTLIFHNSKFTDKYLCFKEISFWNFCEIFCEKLMKIAKLGNYFFMVIGLLLEGRSSTSLK